MPSVAHNLTGLWQGQFSYPRGPGPEFFTATLLETADFLSGSTQEVALFGRSKGRTLYASLSGRREGAQVRFLKTYESETRNHSVRYDGLLNTDGTEIEGTWTVPGNWSGRFLMIRDIGLKVAATRRVAEKLPG